MTALAPDIAAYLNQLHLPAAQSHKGQNGKLLLIGGSELFHAASKWSLDVASMMVDMVFYASVPSNAELVRAAKGEFWNGIVIKEADVAAYAAEADCILMGPGMTRTTDTAHQVQHYVREWPSKKWVIDAGALQMIEPTDIPAQTIITPHQTELTRLLAKLPAAHQQVEELTKRGITVLLKGPVDQIFTTDETIEVAGGNPGMTKGGTGDVLAGLVAALYCTHPAAVAAVIGSYINKAAGDVLFEQVGPYFNASQLAAQVPKTLWQTWQNLT